MNKLDRMQRRISDAHSWVLISSGFLRFGLAPMLLVTAALLTSCKEGSDSNEKGGNLSTDPKMQSKAIQGAARQANFEKTFDIDGKTVWVITLGKSKYHIPERYRPSLDASGAWLYLNWPSMLPSAEIPRQWPGSDGSDQLNVRVTVSRVPRTAAADRARHEMIYPGYTTRPFAEIPDLLRIYDAKGNPTWEFLTNRDDVRMPNGEPFLLNNTQPDQPEHMSRTSIGLPDGNELVVDFRVKHIADWHQIFPKVLHLIESMKEQ